MSLFHQLKQLFTAKENTDNPYKDYQSSRNVPKNTPLCIAPWTSMSFNLDGTVAICCLNKKTTVSIVGKTIKQVWSSVAFEKLRTAISNNDLSHDCSICLHQIEAKGYTKVKAKDYDQYLPYNKHYPKIMEFCLENTCNLACEMCNTTLSSTIRKNNNLPPLKTYYDDDFVNQLDEFIPHLEEAVFVGGEPFLIPIYFKIWERMKELNPTLLISIVTNGTTLNNQIKNILEQGRFRINISIDAIDKTIYEGTRNNAKFERVMKNFEWFRAYGEKNNLPVNIPICPLTSNWGNIPDLVRFASKNNAYINFCYVDKPYNLSLLYTTQKMYDDIIENYSNQKFDTFNNFEKENAQKFNDLLEDIKQWKKNSSSKTDTQNISIKQWEEKVLNDIVTPEEIKKFEPVISIVKEGVTEEPLENQPYLLSKINELSNDRLYQIVIGKTKIELKAMLKDLMGNSKKKR